MSTILEQQLVELARRVDVDAGAQLADDVLARLDDRPTTRFRFRPPRRARAIVALLAAAALAIVFILPSPRRTVAHWFGIGVVRIDAPPLTLPPPTSSTASSPAASSPATSTMAATATSTATEPSTAPTTAPATSTPVTFPSSLDLGEPTSAADASSRTGLPTGLAAALGAPDGIFVVTPPASGQIVVIYAPTPTLPASPVAGVGALLSTLPGSLNDEMFVKVEGPGTTAETLTFTTAAGTSVDAVWLSGEPHQYVFIDSNDQPVFDTLRLATNTLLWEDGDVTYRLEADVSRDAALAIARSVMPG